MSEERKLSAVDEAQKGMQPVSKADSLMAAINGNDDGMSHADLVHTVKMLRNGRQLWKERAERAEAALRKLETAALAVVNRWDTPVWKEAEPTATVIHALRDCLPIERGPRNA